MLKDSGCLTSSLILLLFRELINAVSSLFADTLKPIQIFITNFRNKVKTCTVTPTETIKVLKKKICDKEGIPFDQIQLYTFTGKTLRDEFKMCDYDIHDGCTLNCRMILMNKPKE